MHKEIVQRRYQEVREENRLLPRLRDLCRQTPLTPDRCVVVCPPELQPVAQELNPRLPVGELPGKHQILLGNCFNNHAIFDLYRQHLCFVDHYWPGPGGFVAQTIHNPFGDGRNFVVLGGSDVAGVRQACDVLTGKSALDAPLNVSASAHNVRLPAADVLARAEEQLCAQIRFGPASTAMWTAADYGMFGHLSARPEFIRIFKRVVLTFIARAEELGTWQIEPNALLYFILARVLAAWNVVEPSDVFDDAERLRISTMLYNVARWVAQLDAFQPEHVGSPRTNNHQTFAALSLYLAADYFRRHYGIREFDPLLPAIDGIMRHHARSWKPNDNGGDIYGWLTPHFLLNYFLMRGESEFLDNGNLRRLADYAILTTDNRGNPVTFGDESAYRPPTTRRAGALQPLAIAAWHYREPKYQWAVELLQRGIGYENAHDFAQPHPLIHWEVFDGAYGFSGSTGMENKRHPCSADFQSAVSQVSNLQDAAPPMDALPIGKSAIQQIGNLRYGPCAIRSLDSHLGARAAMLDRPAYDDLCARHNLTAPQVSLDQAFDKISFRRDFDKDSEYLLLGGASGFSHSHEDVNAILRLTWRDRVWLADLGYPRRLARYHNSVVVVRNGESYPKPVLAALRSLTDAGSVTEALDDNGLNWRRQITWEKGRWFLVVDDLEAVEPGDYRVSCYWRVLGDIRIEGSRLIVTQAGERFTILHGSASTFSLREEPAVDSRHWSGGAGDWGNYEHADGRVRVWRQTQRAALQKSERLRFVNLLYLPTIVDEDEATRALSHPTGMRLLPADLINTPLQRGVGRAGNERNRFNGFQDGGQTVETVLACGPSGITPLKRGVTEKLSCAAAHGGELLLGQADGHVRLVNGANEVLWKQHFDKPIESAQLDTAGLFIGAGNGLHVLDRSGQLRWEYSFLPESLSRPAECPKAIVATPDRLFVGTSGRSRLYAFERNGQLLWETELLHWAIVALAAADFDGDGKDEIAVTTRYGSAYLVGADGDVRWSRAFGEDATFTTCDLNGDGHPELIVGGQRGVSAWDGRGDLLWERNLGGQVLAAYGTRQTIIAATEFGELVWIGPRGERLRTLERGAEFLLITELAADGTLVGVARDGRIVRLET